MTKCIKFLAFVGILISFLLTSGCFLALAGGAGYVVGKHEKNKKAQTQKSSATHKTATSASKATT